MSFDFALKNSGYCSLEKEFLMCPNSSIRKLGEQILWPLRKKLMRMALFYLSLWFE